jgi:hypothetical protein
MRAETSKDGKVLFTSAARTTTSSATFNTNCIGGVFIINVTAISATPSVVFTISGTDPASLAKWTILTSAAITGTGTTVLRVHPSLTAAANTVAKDVLPQAIEVAATHGDADSITYSVGFIGVN